MDLLADTTYLIDLWREQRSSGAATEFARRSRGLAVGIPWVVAGEFLAGGAAVGQDVDSLRSFLSRYTVLQPNDAIIEAYAALYAVVRGAGRSMGASDLWIAACAAATATPLLTRNAKDFRDLPKVAVVAYV